MTKVHDQTHCLICDAPSTVVLCAECRAVSYFTTPWGEMPIHAGKASLPDHLAADARQIAEWAVTWLAQVERQRLKRNARRRELRASRDT